MKNSPAFSPRSKDGPLKLVAADDLAKAEEMLRLTADQVVPDFQTQRKAFEKLMPHLSVLRAKGCSFTQLANKLKECGFDLQPSTVSDYFREFMNKTSGAVAPVGAPNAQTPKRNTAR